MAKYINELNRSIIRIKYPIIYTQTHGINVVIINSDT